MMRRAQVFLSLLAMFSLIGGPVMADAPSAKPTSSRPTARVADVRLTPGNILSGQIVDRNGQPRAGARVALFARRQVAARATTDKQGRFQVRLNRGGVYQLKSEQTQTVLRVWTNQAAPASAKPRILVIADQTLTRGQLGGFSGGIDVLSAAVLAGTAITIAVAASNDGS